MPQLDLNRIVDALFGSAQVRARIQRDYGFLREPRTPAELRTNLLAEFGHSHHTLYAWKKRFDELGPAGLDEAPRGRPPGSRLSEPSKRAILMMKSMHPEWGQDRLHAMLLRSEGLSASPGAIARVLLEAGYKVESEPAHAARAQGTRSRSEDPPPVSAPVPARRPTADWQYSRVLKFRTVVADGHGHVADRSGVDDILRPTEGLDDTELEPCWSLPKVDVEGSSPFARSSRSAEEGADEIDPGRHRTLLRTRRRMRITDL